METNKEILNLLLEDDQLMFEILPRFNSIYKQNIKMEKDGEVTKLLNIENLSVNDLFTLGGFYGNALGKKINK